MADAAKAATDLILARRAWVVAARNNDHYDDDEEGDLPVPNYATAGGGEDNNDTLPTDDDAIRGCLRLLNEQTTSLRETSATEKHKLLTKLTHRRVAGQLLL
jgi:hypothetical protein